MWHRQRECKFRSACPPHRDNFPTCLFHYSAYYLFPHPGWIAARANKNCFYWGAAAPQTPCNFYWGASSPPDPLAGGWQPPAPPCIPRGSVSRALRFFLVPRLLDLPEPLRRRFQNFDLSESLRQRFQNFDREILMDGGKS